MKHDKIKPNKESTGQNGYPEKDINVGITHSTMRGAGAATKGKKFVHAFHHAWCWCSHEGQEVRLADQPQQAR